MVIMHDRHRHPKPPEGFTYEPPDGGYAWIVLIGVFFTGIFSASAIDTLPVIFKDLIHLFETNTATISWMPAIVVSGGLLFGPVATMCIKTCGYQKSVILGSFLCASSMIASYFARRVGVLLLIYSITGPGLQLCMMSCNVILSQYFKRNFAVSMGVFNAGISSSRLLLVPMMQLVSTEYGCRAAFLIMGANVLHVCVAATLFQPVEKHLRLTAIIEPSEVNDANHLTNDLDADGQAMLCKMAAPDEAERPKSIHIGSSWDIFGSNNFINLEWPQKNGQVKDTDRTSGKCCTTKCFRRGPCKTIDHTLWREPSFYLICVNNTLMLTLMIFSSFYLYPLGIEMDFTPVETASAVMAKSLADITGKFVGPVIMTMFNLSSRWTYIVLGILHSFLLAVILVVDSYTTFMCLAVVSGLVFGVVSATGMVLIVDCLGVAKFPSVIGLSGFVQAFFTLPMAPFMGWLRDETGNYLTVFLFLALLQFIVAIIWISEPFFKKTSDTPKNIKIQHNSRA